MSRDIVFPCENVLTAVVRLNVSSVTVQTMKMLGTQREEDEIADLPVMG
jgi:hypothetical protein